MAIVGTARGVALSQFQPATQPPALIDRVVGVSAGKQDLLYTLAQVQAAVELATQQAGPPTPSGLTAGQFGLFKDTANGNVTLVYNDGGTLKGVALTPTIILDAHVDHFGTYNLFGGTNGPFWAHVNAWNLSGLTPAQYSEIITLFSTTFPNNTTFSWSFPSFPNGGNVYAYPEIIFGTQAGGGFIVPSHTPPPKTLSSFANLSVTYNINLNLSTSDDASFLIETWPQTVANNPGSNVCELQFLPFPPTANVGQVLGWADHFNFSAGGFNAYIAANPSRSFIQVMPVTAPSGTTPANLILGNQTLPILALIQAIVSQGWLAGTLFLTGIEFGFEVAKNAGNVTINNLAWTWN